MGYTFGDFNQLGAGETDPDVLSGQRILNVFHEASKKYSRYPYRNKTVNDLVQHYGPYKAKVMFDGIGMMARITNVSEAKAMDVMRSLASRFQGQLPPQDQWQTWSQAIGKKASDFSWLDAAKYTAVESAKQIASGAQSIGKTVITTGKVAQFLLPMIPIVALAALYFGLKGRVSGADLKKLMRRKT